MLPPVFQTLKASQAVKDIVGTNPPRIYRHGAAPQKPVGTDAPLQAYVTWFVFSTPENQLSGTPPVDRVTVQVNCYHPTDSGIEQLAEAVRDALEAVSTHTSMPVDQREPETGLYWMGLEFDWFVDR